MTTVRYHPAATSELDEAIRFHRQVHYPLGDEFQQRLADALDRIIDRPEAWHPVEAGARRCRLKQFPYGVVYKVFPDRIVVLAIMHLRRRPGYWVDRIDS